MKKAVVIVMLVVAGWTLGQAAQQPAPQMTPQQALGVLDQATAQLKLNRQETMLIIQALQTLDTYVKTTEAAKQPPAPAQPEGEEK